MTLPPQQRPLFVCIYRDGTKRAGTYADTLLWFQEAAQTDNPCSIKPPDQEYKTP